MIVVPKYNQSLKTALSQHEIIKSKVIKRKASTYPVKRRNSAYGMYKRNISMLCRNVGGIA